MCKVVDIKNFVLNGFSVLRQAAHGNYDGESEAVKAIREEMLSQPTGRMSDKMNLRHDRLMVGRDMRVSFNNIVTANG